MAGSVIEIILSIKAACGSVSAGIRLRLTLCNRRGHWIIFHPWYRAFSRGRPFQNRIENIYKFNAE